jgi:hypothetical protein
MPVIEVPGVGPIQFPDSMTDAEISTAIERDILKPKDDRGIAGLFGSGVVRGARQLSVLTGDVLPGMIGRAVGANEYADRQFAEAKATDEDIQRTNPARYRSYQDVHGFGDVPGYVAESFGEGLPSIAASLVPGGIAGALGARAAGIGATQAARVAMATRYGTLGAGAGAAAQNFPDAYQSIKENTGQEAMGPALVAGAINTALDTVLPAQLLKRIPEGLRGEITGHIAKRLGLGAAFGFATEGVTEGAQEATLAAAENFVDQTKPFWSSETFHRVVDAALKGGIAGAGAGAAFEGALGRRPETPNDRDKELEKALETLRAAAQQNLKDQQLSLGQRPIETPIGVLTPQQIMEYAANSNDPRMLSIVASRASEPGTDAPRVRGRNTPVDPTGLTDTQRVDAIVQLMAAPEQTGTLYGRQDTRSSEPVSEGRPMYGIDPATGQPYSTTSGTLMDEEALRQNDIRRSEAGPAFDIAAEGRRPRVEEGATQDPRWRATATKGEEDLREIPVVPGTNGRPVPVAAAGYALVTEIDEDGEEVQVPRPFVAEVDPRTGEFVEGAEPFQYTDDMRKVTQGVLYPRPGVTNRAMAEMFDASQTARASAEGNQSLSQVTNQARATDRVGTNADMPQGPGAPEIVGQTPGGERETVIPTDEGDPYGTTGRPPRYQPPKTEEKGPRAPRASLDSGFAEAAAFQGDNIPSAEDFTADRPFFGGPAAAQGKPPAARPKKVAPAAPPPASDLFNQPAGDQTTAPGSVPAAPPVPPVPPVSAVSAVPEAPVAPEAAPPAAPASSMVREYAAGDPTLEQRVRDFEQVGSPEVKALVAEADAAAQAIEGLYAATGQTRETAHQGGPGTLGYQLKKRQSELMGAAHRLIAGEVALRKNYKRGSEDRVAADMAELRKMLEEETAPTKPAGTAPVQTPNTPAPAAETAKPEPETAKPVDETGKPAPETDKPADPVETLRSYTEALQAGQTPDSVAAVDALGAYQGQPLADHHIGRLAAFLDMPKAAVARIRAALPRGATIDDWQRAVAAEVAAKPKTNEENRVTMATRRAAGAGDPDAKRLVDAAKTARARRDRMQKELAEAREALRADYQGNGASTMIGGLSVASRRVSAAQADYQAAVVAVGQADAAVAAYRPAPETAKPAPETGKPRRPTTIQTVSGMKVQADYELVDLDSLQAAKGATQPRDRGRAASEGQIAELYRTFDPAQVIEGAGASVGTPIIGPDSTVESGNGRVAAMRRLREEAPERWAAYQQALRDAGYDPGPNQVLVRRRTSELSPEELRRFVTDANSSPTLGMSGTERGMVDRDLIDQSLLSQLDTDADLFAASNDRFVRAFIGKLPANERGTMLDGDGRLSQDGARRIEGAILARAYGDPALLQRIVEDRDDDTRSVSKALLSAAPAWIGLQDAVARGEVKPEFDATPRLLDAVRMLRDMRARKLKANDFLAQQDVFTQPDPLATAFFRAFFNDGLTRAAGAEKIAKVLERYVGEAEKRSPNPLFPDDTTPLQALEAAKKDPQGGLFSTREGGVQPTPGTVSADVAKARQVVANRLAELRAMGKQGVKAAEGVERAMREGFSPQQVVAAFRIAETAARILGDRSLVIRFLPEIMHEGKERQGELVALSPAGTNGLVHFSLSKSSIAFARQTGAHEAFHVAQALFSASEPGLMAALKTAFPEGKGLGGIDATIRRKLQTLQTPDGRGTYWDQLTGDKGIAAETRSDEVQAYVFGALDEARRNGQSLVGIKPIFLRFLNFLAELRQRLGSALRGDGFRSVGDTLAAVSKGTGIRGLTKAADIKQSFSSRAAEARQEIADTHLQYRQGLITAKERDAKIAAAGGVRYEVVDRRTGNVVGTYGNQSRARTEQDKRDNQYGASRYTVRTVTGGSQESFDQALQAKGLFSSRTGDTLQNLAVDRAPRPDGRVDYLMTANFTAGGNLQVYASATPNGALEVIDIAPKGVEKNPHRFETNSELYQGVRLGPAETRKMLRALSNAAKEDGITVRSVTGFRETGARRTSGQQDLAYNLGTARFSSRSGGGLPADLARSAVVAKTYDVTKGQAVKPSTGWRVVMDKFVGAIPGEDWRKAAYRNAISMSGGADSLIEMAAAKGVPDTAGLVRIIDRSIHSDGYQEVMLEHGGMGFDPKTGESFFRDDVPSVLATLVGPDPKNPWVLDSERNAYQHYQTLLRERDLNRKNRSGFTKLKPGEVLAAIKDIEAERPQWKLAAEAWHKRNAALIEFGVKSGILDPVKARELAGMFHTPFYRELEQQALSEPVLETRGPMTSGNGLTSLHAFEKTVHESDAGLGDLFENIIKNQDHIIKSGLKNYAVGKAIDMMEQTTNERGEKLAEQIPHKLPNDKQVITFKRDGQTVMYRLNNKDVTASAMFATLVGLPSPIRNSLFQAAVKMAGIFRTGVTSLPSYMLANLWRGRLAGSIQEGLPWHANILSGLKQAHTASDNMKAIMAGTGFGSHSYGMGEKDMSETLGRKLRTAGGEASALDRLKNGVAHLQKFAQDTEWADRILLVEHLMKQGKSRGEAVHQAVMLAPYNRKGLGGGFVGGFMRVMTPMIPFLASKTQGLARLWENDNGRKRVPGIGIPTDKFLRGTLLGVFSVAAYALALATNKDEWDKEDPSRKLMYDILYTPAGRIYIPRAFEYGTIFGALPVFALEALRGQQGMQDLHKGAIQAFLSTFGFNPVPQAAKPVLEVVMNYDMFRMKPLESQQLQSLPVEDRANEQTSTGAKLLSQGFGAIDSALPKGSQLQISPIKAQKLIEGYTGGLGVMLLAAFDGLLGMTGAIPRKPDGVFGDPSTAQGILGTVSGLGRFYRANDNFTSRFVGDFYEMKAEADQVARAVSEAQLAGDEPKAQRLINANRPLLQTRSGLEDVETQLGDINREMRMLNSRSDIPNDQRRAALAQLRQARNMLSQQAVQAVRAMSR